MRVDCSSLLVAKEVGDLVNETRSDYTPDHALQDAPHRVQALGNNRWLGSTFGPPQIAAYAALRGLLLLRRL
jgi:hypothetical protein